MKRKPHFIWQVTLETLKAHAALSLVLLVSLAGAVGAAVIPPLVLEQFVNALTETRTLLLKLIILYVGITVLAGLLNSVKESLITVYGQKVTHQIRTRMCDKLSRLPAAYFTTTEAGIITSRLVNDVDTVETLFDSGVISMIADAGQIVSILVIVFTKSKGLGILLIMVTPVIFALTRHTQNRMLRAQVDNRVAVGQASNHLPETISNIRVIHNLSLENYMSRRYSKYIHAGYDAMEKSNFYDAVYSPIVVTLSAVLISVVMVGSALGNEWQAFFGMSAGTAVAIISYVSKIFNPIESLGMEIQNIQSAMAGIFRINEFMQEEERTLGEVEDIDETQPPEMLRLDHVCFSYEDDREILHDLSFTIHEKEKVTLMGRTGAGKSTIFKLILGLYPCNQGKVYIEGIDTATLTDAARASQIGYVEQSFTEVPGTVKDQITLGDDSVGEEQVAKAMEIVGLSDSVQLLPQGLETPYNSEQFSKGQIQLLSIARAVVKDPPILLLDEITANLDSETEREVLKALEEAGHNRTVLSISHRGLAGGSRTISIT